MMCTLQLGALFHFRDVNKLADVFGRNPSYLSRRFLRMTGQSILDYIHRYRIQEAKIRIGQGASLAAVAEQVGYSNALRAGYITVFTIRTI